jgi:ABC-type lipoprotein release transport system permease subunit
MTGLHAIAWRSLRARPLRTVLTSIGVALGVAVLYAGLATNAGIDAAVDRAVATMVGSADLRVASFGEGGLSEAAVDAVETAPGVAVAAPTLERRTYLGLDLFGPGDALPAPVSVVGVVPVAEARLHDLTVAQGTALPDDAASLAPVALVSATLAREDELRLGDTVEIQGPAAPVVVEVIGILAGDGPWSGVTGRAVVVPLGVAQAAFDTTGVTRVDVGLDAGASTSSVIAALDVARIFAPI